MKKIKTIAKAVFLLGIFAFPCLAYDLEDELESKIEILEQIIDAESGHIDSLQGRFFALQKENQKLLRRLDKVSAQLLKKEDLVRQLKADLRQKAKKEIVYQVSPEQHREMEKLQAEVKALDKELKQVSLARERLEKDKERQVEGLAGRLQEKERALADLQGQLAESSGAGVDAAGRLQDAAQELEGLGQERAELAAKLAERQQEIENLRLQLNSKTRALEKSQKELQGLSSQEDDFKKKMAGTSQETAALVQAKEELSRRLQDKENELRSLNNRLGEKEGVIEELREKLKVQAQVQAAEGKEAQEKKISQIIAVHEERIAKLNAELDRKDGQLVQLKGQLREKEGRRSTHTKENARLVKETITKDKEIERLTQAITDSISYIGKSLPSAAPLPVGSSSQAIASHKKRINELVRQLGQKDSELAKLEKRLNKKEAKDERYTQGKKELLRELDAKDREIARLKNIIRSAIRRIDKLSSSR